MDVEFVKARLGRSPFRARAVPRSELVPRIGVGTQSAHVPVWLQADERYRQLRPAAKDVVVALLTFTDWDLGYGYPSMETIAATAGHVLRTARRSMREIEAAGLVVTEHRKFRNKYWRRSGWHTSVYRWVVGPWAELPVDREWVVAEEAELEWLRAIEEQRRQAEGAARAQALLKIERRTRARTEWDGLVQLLRTQLDAVMRMAGELARLPPPIPVVRSTTFTSAAEELAKQERARHEDELHHADSQIRRVLGEVHKAEPFKNIEHAAHTARSVARSVEVTLREVNHAARAATRPAPKPQGPPPGEPPAVLSEAKRFALMKQREQLERVLPSTREPATRARLEAALARTIQQLEEPSKTGPPGQR